MLTNAVKTALKKAQYLLLVQFSHTNNYKTHAYGQQLLLLIQLIQPL